ncbi:MAG: hypothetical protein KatS3mg053_2112 [Candidatus Roseilinea sp.]|nr:MAG: hypothetical protein KatS3mg053_2112 [Candidatus Roseilinea sp.]
MRKRTLFLALAVCAALIASVALWAVPIPGKFTIAAGDLRETLTLPRVEVEKGASNRYIVSVTDATPWANVLLMANGQHVPSAQWQQAGNTWVWRWQVDNVVWNAQQPVELVLYHSCDTGCVQWASRIVGTASTAPTTAASRTPTKLGVVFASRTRDWHGRSGWNVELTYVLANRSDDYWMIDNVAERVLWSSKQGLRVLLRIDYDQGQSMPPTNDYAALNTYLNFVRRVANDARFRDVYGLIIGSGFNDNGSNSKAPDRKVTPEWYARVFNGYSVDHASTDNVVETIRSVNSHVRVLVGPVRPWNRDQDGKIRWEVDVPWLNYVNTLVAALDASARDHAKLGRPYLAPDGFAVQAPGRPDAPEIKTADAAREPKLDLQRREWNGAQAGFRVYRDWIAIVNAYTTTRGLPIFISSTNTFAPDTRVPPAQNYPKGWLTNALDAINQEPQVQALCWFMDSLPSDEQWDLFNLTKQKGLLVNAANEFDALLRARPQ